MTSPRLFHPGRLVIVAALWGAVVVLLMVSFHPEWDRPLWLAVFDSAHLPVFTSMGAATVWMLARRGRRETAGAFLLVALLAAGTEGAQLFTERDATLADLAWNLVGGGIGVALGRAWLLARDRAREAAARYGSLGVTAALGALALALFAFAAAPAARELLALRHFRGAFPTMGDFETEIELVWWRPSGGARVARAREGAAQGEFALRVDPGRRRGRWPGVGIEGRAFDWSGYDSLALHVANPGAEMALVVRIDDDGACRTPDDRFNERFEIPSGGQDVVVPLSRIETGPRARRLRLDRIRAILLYIERTPAASPFAIDAVRLIRAAGGASGPAAAASDPDAAEGPPR